MWLLLLLVLLLLLGYSFVGAAVWIVKVLLFLAVVAVLLRLIRGERPL